MPRSKSYETSAEKQRAYRLRKQGLELVEKEAVGPNESGGGMDVGKCANIPKSEHEGFDYARAFPDSPTVVPEGAEKQQLEPTAVVVTAIPERKLSATDQKFDEDRPGWYIFEKEAKKRECWKCGKPFKTQLEMNKFCSPKCKNEYLDSTSLRGSK